MNRPPRATPVSGKFRSLQDADSLRALVANLGEGIYIATARGVILDANPAFFRMLGVGDLAELGHYGLNDLVVDPRRRMQELEQIDEHGSVREFELEIVLPDGSHRTVLDTTFAVRDPDTDELFYHGILVDISDRKALEERLRSESTRDPLTGCYNRRWLHELEDRLHQDPKGQWACLFIDIDHFKQYNEEHGHRMGDTTLVRMARFLMRQIRAEESVVRVGGDEFLLVLEGANEEATKMVADRLKAAALRTAPVPFSLGWAVRQNNEALRQTVHRADKNLLAVRVIERAPTVRAAPEGEAE
jgi:diguanylate cyclase (GGDEF)-like protein/PAS domain S-box-containing protein